MQILIKPQSLQCKPSVKSDGENNSYFLCETIRATIQNSGVLFCNNGFQW